MGWFGSLNLIFYASLTNNYGTKWRRIQLSLKINPLNEEDPEYYLCRFMHEMPSCSPQQWNLAVPPYLPHCSSCSITPNSTICCSLALPTLGKRLESAKKTWFELSQCLEYSSNRKHGWELRLWEDLPLIQCFPLESIAMAEYVLGLKTPAGMAATRVDGFLVHLYLTQLPKTSMLARLVFFCVSNPWFAKFLSLT